jgi:hypothetical protein
MLAAISQVLNECTKPDQATPAALVLQGLHALCQAEVGVFELFWITNILQGRVAIRVQNQILVTESLNIYLQRFLFQKVE